MRAGDPVKWKNHPDHKWRVDWVESGNYKRKGFKTKVAAEEWRDARDAELQEHGVQAANLTATERAAVVELRTALEEVGLSVREALSIAIAQRKREQSCTQPVRKVRKHLPLPRRQGPLGVLDWIVEEEVDRLDDRPGGGEGVVVEALAVPDRAGLSPLHRIEAPGGEAHERFAEIAHQGDGEPAVGVEGVLRRFGPADGVIMEEPAAAGKPAPEFVLGDEVARAVAPDRGAQGMELESDQLGFPTGVVADDAAAQFLRAPEQRGGDGFDLDPRQVRRTDARGQGFVADQQKRFILVAAQSAHKDFRLAHHLRVGLGAEGPRPAKRINPGILRGGRFGGSACLALNRPPS